MAAKRHPLRQFYGSAAQTTLQLMRINWPIADKFLDEIGYQGRRVLGYKLPDWQRGTVWSQEQSQSFIESIWVGVGLGAFMWNESADQSCDLVLLDGQQRLTAIQRYWRDEITVVGEDGIAYTWSDLTPEEHAHFLRIPFPYFEMRYSSEVLLKKAYDRHNFGGTAHGNSERALPTN